MDECIELIGGGPGPIFAPGPQLVTAPLRRSRAARRAEPDGPDGRRTISASAAPAPTGLQGVCIFPPANPGARARRPPGRAVSVMTPRTGETGSYVPREMARNGSAVNVDPHRAARLPAGRDRGGRWPRPDSPRASPSLSSARAFKAAAAFGGDGEGAFPSRQGRVWRPYPENAQAFASEADAPFSGRGGGGAPRGRRARCDVVVTVHPRAREPVGRAQLGSFARRPL